MKIPSLLSVAVILVLVVSAVETDQPRYNILRILADGLGYGDVLCCNDQSKIATRNIDRLARAGMRFAGAHSPVTVCTLLRHSLMTGQMAFHVPNGGRVFEGIGGPPLITPSEIYNFDSDPGERRTTALSNCRS